MRQVPALIKNSVYFVKPKRSVYTIPLNVDFELGYVAYIGYGEYDTPRKSKFVFETVDCNPKITFYVEITPQALEEFFGQP